jgi:hypothetical protein
MFNGKDREYYRNDEGFIWVGVGREEKSVWVI